MGDSLDNTGGHPDVDEQYEALQAADEANGVAAPPALFNNTYAIAMTGMADELGISTISRWPSWSARRAEDRLRPGRA